MAKRKYKRLHYEDRQTIEAMSKQGSSVSDIAEALGIHRDTIYREFKRCNATLKTYTAAAGQRTGSKVYYTEVVANSVGFGESKAEAEARGQQLPESDGFMNIPEGADEELPFN